MKGVYGIFNIQKIGTDGNPLVYVGKSLNIEGRIKDHECDLKNGADSPLLQNDYTLQNGQGFEWRVLEQLNEGAISIQAGLSNRSPEELSQEQLQKLEQSYIEKYKAIYKGYGYNIRNAQ